MKFKKTILEGNERAKKIYKEYFVKSIEYRFNGQKFVFDVLNYGDIYYNSFDKTATGKFLEGMWGLFIQDGKVFENRDKIKGIPADVLEDLMKEMM